MFISSHSFVDVVIKNYKAATKESKQPTKPTSFGKERKEAEQNPLRTSCSFHFIQFNSLNVQLATFSHSLLVLLLFLQFCVHFTVGITIMVHSYSIIYNPVVKSTRHLAHNMRLVVLLACWVWYTNTFSITFLVVLENVNSQVNSILCEVLFNGNILTRWVEIVFRGVCRKF